MDTTKVKRMIVCAAIHYQNGKFYDIQQPWNTKASGGLVVCGHNHSVCISLLALLFPNLEYKGKTVDGFVRYPTAKAGGLSLAPLLQRVALE